MKQVLILCVAMTLAASCVSGVPNDRACHNLQGDVKSVTQMRDDSSSFVIEFDGSGFEFAAYDYIRSRGYVEANYDFGTYKWQFDRHGRLVEYTEGIYMADEDNNTQFVESEVDKYYYKGKDRLPYALEKTTLNIDDPDAVPVTIKDDFVYEEVDAAGNFTKATWNGTTLNRMIEYGDINAEVINCDMSRRVDWNMVGSMILAILAYGLLMLIVGGVIFHMVKLKYFSKKIKEDWTVGDFNKMRAEASTGEIPLVTETEVCVARLRQLFDSWEDAGNLDNGEQYRLPIKKSQIKAAHEAVDNVVASAPISEDSVYLLNKVSIILNEAENRTFAGSKAFIICALIIGVLFSVIMKEASTVIFMAVSSLIYYLSSQKPNFLLYKKELKGKGGKPSFMSGVLAGVFGSVATAKAVTTVTEWSDGSTTKETDHSETWIAMIIGFIAILVLSFFMIIIAAVNYLRNYILYW